MLRNWQILLGKLEVGGDLGRRIRATQPARAITPMSLQRHLGFLVV